MSRDLWLAMTTLLWDEQTTSTGLDLAPRMEDGSIGFLPLFASREEAEAAYPEREVVQVRTRGDGGAT